jgi:multifunctional methyltransferase subunit TRM112
VCVVTHTPTDLYISNNQILPFVLFRTTDGFPLIIEPERLLVEDSVVDTELILRLVPKLEYSAIRQAVQQLAHKCEEQGIALPELPDHLPHDVLVDKNATFITHLHRVLFDIHVQEGYLVCPSTGRKFPIKDGIPNMILHEDEV